MTLDHFYWLEDGVLAGCARPGGTRANAFNGAGGFGSPGPDDDAELDRHLEWLVVNGIGAILNLTEYELPPAALLRHGITGKNLPIPDMAAPSPEQLRIALDFIDWHRTHNRGVLVHCRMGQGRTGTVLAAYLIRAGADADQAIAQVRAVCPNAVESPPQVRALRDFAAERGWLV